MNITAKQLDRLLFDALEAPCDTEIEKLNRTLSVTNIKAMYIQEGLMMPIMHAVQQQTMAECHDEAVMYGIEREHNPSEFESVLREKRADEFKELSGLLAKFGKKIDRVVKNENH